MEELHHPLFLLFRDLANITGEYFIMIIVLIQIPFAFLAKNPILLGLHLGESLGQLIFSTLVTLQFNQIYISELHLPDLFFGVDTEYDDKK